MEKPTIFLSHISEEKALASVFKDQIEKSFLGLVNIFVSSDTRSIPLGRNWLDQVTDELRSCRAMLLLCSPVSIGRPWINFEAGAAWARSIEVAPICHSGLRPVDLPLPMSLLQGVEAHDGEKIGQVFQLIARQLGATNPSINTADFVREVLSFEGPYSLKIRYGADLSSLKFLNEQVFQFFLAALPSATAVMSGLPERDFIQIRGHLDNLQRAGALQYNFGVTGMVIGGSNGGSVGSLTAQVTQELKDLMPLI